MHVEVSLELPRQHATVPTVRRVIGRLLDELGVAEDVVGDVQLAVSEACNNVVLHAQETDAYKVAFELDAERVTVTVIDSGGGFDVETLVPAGDEAEQGRGLSLMRALMDAATFTPVEGGTAARMETRLSLRPDSPFAQLQEGSGALS